MEMHKHIRYTRYTSLTHEPMLILALAPPHALHRRGGSVRHLSNEWMNE